MALKLQLIPLINETVYVILDYMYSFYGIIHTEITKLADVLNLKANRIQC